MKNIHNAIIFSTKEEEALKLALKIKEQVKKKYIIQILFKKLSRIKAAKITAKKREIDPIK